MSGTLSHAASQLVTRPELFAIPTRPATARWKPIAYADLVQAIERQLLVRGVHIAKEQFAVQRQSARLFAVLDLKVESVAGATAAMGVRTLNDRSMALKIAVDVKVFVCDNLAFSGDLIALRRKHTTTPGTKLAEVLSVTGLQGWRWPWRRLYCSAMVPSGTDARGEFFGQPARIIGRCPELRELQAIHEARPGGARDRLFMNDVAPFPAEILESELADSSSSREA